MSERRRSQGPLEKDLDEDAEMLLSSADPRRTKPTGADTASVVNMKDALVDEQILMAATQRYIGSWQPAASMSKPPRE
jgi:hypothetical protein